MASIDTPGNAVDVAVDNDLAIVADAEAGVAIFNVADKQRRFASRKSTRQVALSVSIDGSLAAVADSGADLAVISSTRVCRG
jgi:hypothetical protein